MLFDQWALLIHIQVRFVYESLRRLRPGVPIMPLYGKQKQMKRMAIFKDFAKKQAAVSAHTNMHTLISLLIPALGLDCDRHCCSWA